jgi:hypothetical protein
MLRGTYRPFYTGISLRLLAGVVVERRTIVSVDGLPSRCMICDNNCFLKLNSSESTQAIVIAVCTPHA